MRKLVMIIAICSVMLSVSFSVMAAPKAEIDQPVFTFDSVVEGVSVYHEFVLKNSGDTPLTVLNVLPP